MSVFVTTGRVEYLVVEIGGLQKDFGTYLGRSAMFFIGNSYTVAEMPESDAEIMKQRNSLLKDKLVTGRSHRGKSCLIDARVEVPGVFPSLNSIAVFSTGVSGGRIDGLMNGRDGKRYG